MHIPGDEDKRAIFSEMGKVRKRTKTQKNIKNGEIFYYFWKGGSFRCNYRMHENREKFLALYKLVALTINTLFFFIFINMIFLFLLIFYSVLNFPYLFFCSFFVCKILFSGKTLKKPSPILAFLKNFNNINNGRPYLYFKITMLNINFLGHLSI